MGRLVKIIKGNVKAISWPSKKNVALDTTFVLFVTIILMITIAIWTSGIDLVAGWLVSLFT